MTGHDENDVPQIPASPLVASAAVLDCSKWAAADPDLLLELDDIQGWESEHGTLSDGC